MEKISRILPASPRFYGVEKSRSQPARPGAIEMGRATKAEAEAAKVSVSHLAREILKQAETSEKLRLETPLEPQIDLPKLEPLSPVKNRDVQESSSDKAPAVGVAPEEFFSPPPSSPKTVESSVE